MDNKNMDLLKIFYRQKGGEFRHFLQKSEEIGKCFLNDQFFLKPPFGTCKKSSFTYVQ